MRLLADTHILLWWLEDSPSLPHRARRLLADRTNPVFISPISIWEIAIKVALGELRVDVHAVLDEARGTGFQALPFSLDHAAAIAELPPIHQDPFDRALVAQARLESLYLLTHDRILIPYGEHVLLV